jgi:hypothetical protein
LVIDWRLNLLYQLNFVRCQSLHTITTIRFNQILPSPQPTSYTISFLHIETNSIIWYTVDMDVPHGGANESPSIHCDLGNGWKSSSSS